MLPANVNLVNLLYLQRFFSQNMIDFKMIYKGKPSEQVNVNHYQTNSFKKYSSKPSKLVNSPLSIIWIIYEVKSLIRVNLVNLSKPSKPVNKDSSINRQPVPFDKLKF